MLTLKAINKEIQKRWPNVEVVKGEGYFYLYSEDEATRMKLAGMYTTSIYCFRVNHMKMETWISSVESLMNSTIND